MSTRSNVEVHVTHLGKPVAYGFVCEALLTGYSDADYASCKDDRKSVTGYCFSYNRSGAISWSAKKQTCVATSTTEVEVHALSEAVKQTLHLSGILECIGETKQTTIRSDSQLCLALVSKDDGSHKAKHFATGLAFLKNTVKCSEHRNYLKFVSSADNIAVLFTKGLSRLKTIQHTKGLSTKRGCQV